MSSYSSSPAVQTSTVVGVVAPNPDLKGNVTVNGDPGTAGQVLTSSGPGAAPTWQDNASGDGTVTTVSVVSANGVSGSVANATTTPAITLTLGDIAPAGVKVPTATLSALPAATTAGQLLFVSDANSDVGTICFADGTAWIDIKTGLTVA